MAEPVRVVAGLTLKNLHPRVWDASSPYYVPELEAVMVSYAEFHRMPVQRRKAAEQGLHAYLGVDPSVRVYLDNGAFSFLRASEEVPREDYAAFVRDAKPDWYAIPQDYIPTPRMTDDEQLDCLRRTMAMNRRYSHDGYVPVIHVSRRLDRYIAELREDDRLWRKPVVGLGAIVPNLLRSPKAMSGTDVLATLRSARRELADKRLHVFGLGGTATIHIAALLGVDSVDSSGWRNRAARGIVQLPGRGDRMVADLGTWRGREPDAAEEKVLAACACPSCRAFGPEGLRGRQLAGFCHRAAHNLWVLVQEAELIAARLDDGTYAEWHAGHLDNTVYLPLIRETLKMRHGT